MQELSTTLNNQRENQMLSHERWTQNTKLK